MHTYLMGTVNMFQNISHCETAIRTAKYNFSIEKTYICKRGHAVAQLVEVLRYKPEGSGFYSRWCHPGVDSASNINEYKEYFLGIKAAGA